MRTQSTVKTVSHGINIGISGQDRAAIAKGLSKLRADTYAFCG